MMIQHYWRELPPVSFFCRDTETRLCREKYFVLLSRQKYRDKGNFVKTKLASTSILLSRQGFESESMLVADFLFFRDKQVNVLSRQKYFVATSILLWRQKLCFVSTNTRLSRQKLFLWQLPPVISSWVGKVR